MYASNDITYPYMVCMDGEHLQMFRRLYRAKEYYLDMVKLHPRLNIALKRLQLDLIDGMYHQKHQIIIKHVPEEPKKKKA